MRELVRRVLDVHNSMKGAQLRLAANATVRTYGIEIREVIMAARAAMSRLTSDIGGSGLLSPDTKGRCAPHARCVICYLQGLVNEYNDHYPEYSRWQAISSKLQGQALDLIVRGGLPAGTKPPREILSGESYEVIDRSGVKRSVRLNDSDPWDGMLKDLSLVRALATMETCTAIVLGSRTRSHE